ncbi:MAG: Tetratricopeptide 2 repeat protein [Caulobacter sp.]|nr:Tetratricopeptide 2 repeat protein [Caulobacter sp.]
MMRLKVLFAAASLSALAACATTTPPPGQPALRGGYDLAAAITGGRSAYGQFLAGQAALQDGRSRDAAGYFSVAEELDEDPGVIAERTFTSALLAGEVRRAAAIAPQAETTAEAVKRLGALTRAVDLMSAGKGREAQAILRGPEIGFPHRSVAVLLAPWAAAQAGDAEGAIVRPELQGDRLVQFFGQLGQARLYERAKRYDEAETDYKALIGNQATADLFVLDYGAYLERRKRGPEAVALYDVALTRHPGGPALVEARARAAKRGAPPPMPTARQAASQAVVACAAAFVSERQAQFGLAYLRLALALDPQRADAWLLVGDLLGAGGDVDGAREALNRIPASAPEYSTAQAKLAWTYQAAGDGPGALKLAEQAVKAAPNEREAQIVLADILRANDRFAESAKVLDGVIGAEAAKPDWRLLYMRGIALDRAGRWDDAQTDLQAALKLNPDEPELLNFLGYSWIDRGERLDEAMAMVQKAVDARPQSGAMTDSLGWAQYRRGDYKAAVATLERAVELEPGDPDINGHLGDAYWRMGRRTEAQFQWRRVLSLEPDARQKAEAEAKLKDGLGQLGPAMAPSIARN